LHRAFFLAAILWLAGDAVAQDRRPIVGLVLGGGGARGGAHMGVLEVLEELRIPVDCVAGTSMGALVAGAYVAGVTPAEMQAKIKATDWAAIFDDNAERDLLTLRRRQIDERFISALEFGVTRQGLQFREGAVAGEKIKLFFGELVRADLGDRNIEQLPLPLTLIATDIGTGERVAMRTGNLTAAMRASMSVPGALAPVIREGRKLVDGGLVDNVPVQEVRDRCNAEVVIAVNVGSPLSKPEDVTGVVSIVGQMVNLLAEQNVAKSLSLLGPRDVYMRPELGDITAASFERQIEAAAIGRQTALAQVEKLRALSVSPEEYAAWRAKVALAPIAPPVIDEVRVAGTRFIHPGELRANISQEEGQPLDSKRLADDLLNFYSRGDLQSLDYSVLRERDKTILTLVPVEKSWGPDYLRFGLNIESDMRSESNFNLRALYRKTWLNAFGGEWLVLGQIGSEQGAGTEIYQPLDYRQRWFLRPYLSTYMRKVDVFFDGSRVAEYKTRTNSVGVDVGARLGTHGQAKVGWLERDIESRVDTGTQLFPDAAARVGGIAANLVIDQYDLPFFPSKGYRAELDYFDAQRVADGGRKYAKGEVHLGAAMSIGDFILRGALGGGWTPRGALPVYEMFKLGGLGRLAAFAPGQLVGEEYSLGLARLEYRLLRPIPILGVAASAGISYEQGKMKQIITEPNLHGWLDSYSVYLAANTPIGPLYFGWADSKSVPKGRVYLFLGTP
jgi:NTE family protein